MKIELTDKKVRRLRFMLEDYSNMLFMICTKIVADKKSKKADYKEAEGLLKLAKDAEAFRVELGGK